MFEHTEMSFASTSRTHPAPTHSFISLSFTTPVTDPATSTIVSSSSFESAGSRSSQVTFASSDTLTPLSITAVPLKSDVHSGSFPFASTVTSSYKLSAAITNSPSSHTIITSSQIATASNSTISSFIETALQTSFSNSESIYPSQIEVSSGLTTSDTLSASRPPTSSHTTPVSETTPANTPDFTSSNNGATSDITSSNFSSITWTSTIKSTPSAGPSATSDLSPYIHSYTIQTGEDSTHAITSPYSDSTPNTSGPEKHKSTPPNTGVSTQSLIPGVATDTGSESFRSVQWASQPSDVITAPPTMNTMSYSQTEHSNNGLTSLSPITVDLTTSACQGRSLTVSESELSTSTAFVRLRNTVQDTTYTTTFTSLKTLFTIATITASPTPTIVTTSTPYLTETEVITTTVVVHNSADVTATTMVPASKADGVSRLSKAQIGGIIAGAVGLFTVLAAILICLILRKRRRNFALDSQNKKPCTEVDAEMTNEIDGRNLRQSMIGQVPVSTLGSEFAVHPPSGQLPHNTSRVSSSLSTVSYQHASRTDAADSTNDLTPVYAQTSSSSSVDMNNHSDEEHSTESSSYLTAQTVTTEFLVSESPDLSVDPTSRRMSQSSRMAYEKEIERLRQEILSQAERIRYMDEQMELMQPRSPPPPSYHSSRRSAISTQTSRSSLSQPPPLPSREISY